MNSLEYKGGSLIEYLRKVDEYDWNRKQEKYDLVHKFLLDILNIECKEYSALSKIRNIPKRLFFANSNITIVCNKYADELEQLLELKLHKLKKTVVKNKYLISSLKKILNAIDYEIVQKKSETEEFYYTIRQKINLNK